MFKTLEIENFKAFGELQKIPLKPITLIFGPNSSGKSSIIHSLIYLHHALKTENLDVVNTEKGGSSVDLGGIEQLVHNHNLNSRISWGIEIDASEFKDQDFIFGDVDQRNIFNNPAVLFDDNTDIALRLSIGVELDDQDKPVKGEKPKVYSYEIFAGGEKFLKFSLRPDEKFKLDIVNSENILTKKVIDLISSEGAANSNLSFEQELVSLVPDLLFTRKSFLPSGIDKKLNVNNLREQELHFINFINAFTNFVNDYLKEELDKLEYLGPLRSYPPRVIELAEENDPNFRAGGGFAWKKVLEDSEVRESVNNWLSSDKNLQTKYKLSVKLLHSIGKINEYYKRRIFEVIDNALIKEHEVQPDIWSDAEGILDEIKEFEDDFVEKKELVLREVESNIEVTHRDIGIGISQVLPVLVSALGHENKSIAIEQPEIHLHPTLQSSIAKVFIEGVREKNNNFIIETHSEHFIKSLQIEVAKWSSTKGKEGISPEEISILYVTKNHKVHDGAMVKEMELDTNGSFIEPWPDDFFEQSNQLTIERLKQISK